MLLRGVSDNLGDSGARGARRASRGLQDLDLHLLLAQQPLELANALMSFT